MNITAKLFAPALLALVAAACSSTTTTAQPTEAPLKRSEAETSYLIPARCQKQDECSPTSFAKSFPGGMDACVAQFDKNVMMNPDAYSGTSPCTRAQIKKCVDDYATTSCPANLDAAKYPMTSTPELPCLC
jgi:hypothetical protein